MNTRKKKIRAVIFGYHNVGYECLKLLIKKGYDIPMVVTHEDDPDENVWFKSVLSLAKENSIPVYTPKDCNTEDFVELVRKADPEIIFSFYYRYILSPEILKIPRLGAFNLHGSLLPKYRGRCPVNWVLVKGEKETGVTIHYMTEKPDKGNIVVQRVVPVRFSDTAFDLFGRIMLAAPMALSKFLRLLVKGDIKGVPQDNTAASYFGGRKPEDGKILWGSGSRDVYNLVRAVTHPYPGAFTFFNGEKIFVWQGVPLNGKFTETAGTVGKVDRKGARIATCDGMFIVKRAQIEGGVEKDAQTVFAEAKISAGGVLGK